MKAGCALVLCSLLLVQGCRTPSVPEDDGEYSGSSPAASNELSAAREESGQFSCDRLRHSLRHRGTPQLIAFLDDRSEILRECTAEVLADRCDPEIRTAVLKRLRYEPSSDVRSSLFYVLLSHGDKRVVHRLSDGTWYDELYLEKVTGTENVLPTHELPKWIADMSASEFNHIADLRMKWRRFTDFCEVWEERTSGKPCSFDPSQSWLLNESPEAKAWPQYRAAMEHLRNGGPRSEVVAMLRQFVVQHPNAFYADEALDLLKYLPDMVDADQSWKEPSNTEVLPLRDRIAYHVYHIRNAATAKPTGGVGETEEFDVLDLSRTQSNACNSVEVLDQMGEPAFPVLFELLYDRRPTRAVGFWSTRPRVTVLRYRDVAVRILYHRLCAILDESLRNVFVTFMDGGIPSHHYWLTGDKEKGNMRSTIDSARLFYNSVLNDSMTNTMATAHDGRGRLKALERLTTLYAERPVWQRPYLSSCLCELGDTAQIGEVLGLLTRGAYDVYCCDEGEGYDSCPDYKAASYVVSQTVLYGTKEQRDVLLGYAQAGGYTPVKMPNPVRLWEWEKTPAMEEARSILARDVERRDALIEILVSLLVEGTIEDATAGTALEESDRAAVDISALTGMDFGVSRDSASRSTRNRAVRRIQKWWKEYRSGRN